MSYDLALIDKATGEVIEIEDNHQMKGGTYAVGGTSLLKFNVTYNYSKILYKIFGENGLRTLYGLTPDESIKLIDTVIPLLDPNDTNPDYWQPCDNNVLTALRSIKCLSLLALLHGHPDCVWDGD